MKKQITPPVAKALAKKYLSKVKSKEDSEFLLVHSEAVGEIAAILCEDPKIDKDLLRIAGWLHDIGYSVSDEGHALHSLELIEEDYEVSPELKDCILNHGSNGKPETKEGKIIHAADKASVLNPEMLSVFVKYSDNKLSKAWLDFAENKLAKNAFKFLRELEL